MTERKEPTKNQISRVAYGLYRERGGAHGKDVEDWVRAEKELTRERMVEPVRTKAALVGHA